MDLLAHSIAQGRVDQLVLLNASLPGKDIREYDGLEMMTIAADFYPRARYAGLYKALNVLWRYHSTDPI